MGLRYAELGRSVGKPIKVEKAGDVILADLDEEIISVKGGLPYVSKVCLTLGEWASGDQELSCSTSDSESDIDDSV